MRRPTFRHFIPLLVLLGLVPIFSQKSSAYDEQVYGNLLKSRDALASQQSELQTAYDDTKRQMDVLNAKLTRIDTYLKQVNTSLKDVDTALLYAKQ